MNPSRSKSKPKPAFAATRNAQSTKRRSASGAKSKSNGSAGSTVFDNSSFPIVGVGASAGGLEAFTQLLNHLPANSGMAMVLVQHLAPKHESALPDLLSRTTKIPVSEVLNGMAVKPDHIYVIPPNTSMVLRDGVLRLAPRSPEQIHLPIDLFFTSLAKQRGSSSIGVILSGTASDGTQGMQAIKAEGGITFAQDEKSARYSDMPRNAIAAGCVDFVLPPERIAQELTRITQRPDYLDHARQLKLSTEADGNDLVKIFVLLRKATQVDFTHYKRTTINRRLKRRMLLHKAHTLKAYWKFLKEHPAEVDALFRDILIHVTGFFRDRAAFEALKRTIFPRLMKDRPANTPIRIWVPGCSTGEEAYSIAMILTEYLSDASLRPPAIQIFATDISDAALEKARAGVYPEKITAEVSADRIQRFFIHTAKGYQISQTIRDMCIFARQDVIRDTPFSRLDLISCRNLLIYLDRVLQQKVVPTLHYALKPSGYLLLGISETITNFSDYFSLLDKKFKIYAKKAHSARPPADFAGIPFAQDKAVGAQNTAVINAVYDVRKEADRILLSHYVPAGVVVNSDLQILQFHGRTSRYLEPTPGQASLSLTKMAREGMLIDLRAAIQKAKKEDAPVRKRGVHVRVNGEFKAIDIEVVPFDGSSGTDRYFLILFKESVPAGKTAATASGKTKSISAEKSAEMRRVERLSAELAQTKTNLQSIIEEQESANEELNSANEEILSSNEELQSTNEELETAKEELQSTNEELTTLNEELQNRNSELNVLNNDLVNLLSIAQIPLLILGRDLRIRRFTPQAEKLLNLIPGDVGRPIGDIKSGFNFPEFEAIVASCIHSGVVKQREIQDRRGYWYTVRVRPYKTTESKIDGAVVTWNDINAFKTSLDERYDSLLRRNLAGVFRSTPAGQFLECNDAYAKILGCESAAEVVRHETGDFYFSSMDQEKFIAQLKRGVPVNIELNVRRKDGTAAAVLMNAVQVEDPSEPDGVIEGIVLDISARKEAQGLHENLGQLLEMQDQERRRISRELHDSISSTMTGLVASLAQVRKGSDKLGQKERAALQESLNLAKECSTEVRTISYLLHPPLLDELGLASALRWLCEGFTKRSGVQCSVDLPPKLERMPGEVERALFRIVQEGLSNVHRHARSSVARVRLLRGTRDIVLEISDEGRGMPRDGNRSKRKGAREGVGIPGMKERLKQLGGRLEIESSRNGTTVRAIVPFPKSIGSAKTRKDDV